jgi:hypothetical protein
LKKHSSQAGNHYELAKKGKRSHVRNIKSTNSQATTVVIAACCDFNNHLDVYYGRILAGREAKKPFGGVTESPNKPMTAKRAQRDCEADVVLADTYL